MTSKKLLLILFLAFTIPVFAQDADMTLIPYRQGNLWGYANSYKSIIIKPEYEDVDLFYEGYAVVKKGGKYGYINNAGKVVIPIKYLVAKPFRFGYFAQAANLKPGDGSINPQKQVLFAGASLQANGYEICIDPKGVTLPKCPAISDNSATDLNKPPTTTVISNYSTIQKTDLFDKIIADYKIIAGADETYYIAVRNNNYGVFNNKFEVIVPFEHSMIEKINIGAMVYLKTEKAGLKGILFGNGSPYMALENSRLDHVQAKDGNSYFIFTKEGKTGIKNTRYKNIAEAIYENITYHENGGFILTLDGMKGFCFLNGNIVTPQYADVKPLKGGQFIKITTPPAKADNISRTGYISNELVEYFEN